MCIEVKDMLFSFLSLWPRFSEMTKGPDITRIMPIILMTVSFSSRKMTARIRATITEDFIVSAESHALAWVELDRLEAVTREPSLLRMREKWRRLRAGA